MTVNSVAAGFFLGLLNWTFWHFGTKWLLSKKGLKRGAIAFLSLFKLGILAAVIWGLLAKYNVDPIGFLLGFSILLVLTLVKSLF